LLAAVLAALAIAVGSRAMAETAPASAGSIEEQPLAPRSGLRGKTLFTIIPPEESGLRTENAYDDPAIWGRLSREFDLGAVGTGVAIGDYDNDGLPDIFVVSKTGSCRLFHNLGNWKFEDVTEKAGVGDHGAAAKIWKQGATFVDVNNDGLLDIYVCRFNAPNLLYINQGDGTFKEEAHAYGLDVTDGSVMAYFYDYDRDGWLDVFIQTNVLDAAAHPEGQRSYLFHNNRNGTFTDVTDRAGVPRAGAWELGGLVGLRRRRLAGLVCRERLRRSRCALPQQPRRHVHGRHRSHRAAHALFVDGLGPRRRDERWPARLLVADMAEPGHVEDQRAMAESRARMRVPEEGSNEVRQFPSNALFLNTGTGRCLEAAHLAGLDATGWTWAPLWEDLDNDGRADLFRHERDVPGDPQPGSDRAPGHGRRARSPANRSCATARYSPKRTSRLRNLGGLRFENASSAWGLDQNGVSFGAALGDLNGDGNMDLVYSNYQGGVTLLRNGSDTGHRIICALRGTRSNRFGVGAKVTLESAAGIQVRTLALGRGFMSSSEPIVHFGLGEDAVVRRLTVSWPSGAVQTFENLPADRRFIITEPSSPQGAPAPAPRPEPQFAETSRAANLSWTAPEDPLTSSSTSGCSRRAQPQRPGDSRWRPSTAADGTACASEGPRARPGESSCHGDRRRGRKRLRRRLAAPPEVDDGPLLLFDATGEGRADLLVTAGGASQPAGAPEYQPRLFLNDGRGHFKPAPDGALPPLSISAGAACAADFDHSGPSRSLHRREGLAWTLPRRAPERAARKSRRKVC
jgi:enediyne biosynthesis protein E4